MKRLAVVFLCVLSVFFISCSRAVDSTSSASDSGSVSSGTASIKVRELLKTDKPTVKVLAVIENVGSADAANFVCTIKPRKGATILESHTITSNATLMAHEDTWVEVVFDTVTTHADYDDIVFDFSWQESKQGTISLTEIK